MKKLLICIIALTLITPLAMAQNAPQGMKYQAVARDLSGAVLANQKVTLKIDLQSGSEKSDIYYTEFHSATTNKLGLFSLVIGSGKTSKGKFKAIPWSSQDVWMSIGIMDENTEEFTTVSNSKLLAVPYAFHAGTASEVVNNDQIVRKGPKDGVPSQNWSLFGNSKSDPEKDKLGTTDAADFVMVTNNIERLRITADGEIITGDGKFTIGGNLEVQGDKTNINKDLYVGRNVYLNENDAFDPRGQTINNGNFTVENMSSTLLTGTLDVDKATSLGAELDVIGNGFFGKNVVVTDTLFSDVLETKSFNLSADVADGDYLASFENTNNGNGDGINIKLGKTHPGWDGSAYINATNPVAEYFDVNIQNIRDAVTGADEFTFGDAIQLIPATLIAGTACGLLELLVEELNDALGLPYDVDLPALCVTVDFELDTVRVCVPGFSSATNLFTVPAIPDDFCGDLPMLSMPNINFVNVSNSLTNANHFLEFSDKDNRSLGSVRAVSVTEWGNNYFDGVWLSQFIQKSVGIDPLDAITGIVNVGTQLVDDYNKIGVEYTSGNGDYAEWLERLDPKEFISKGDIVGVIGGKITKDLENAEQIMAVSEIPIMLGNIPEKNKEYLGNNVAFMGQIPVKVIGKVNSGDYIIANTKVPGYGIAVNPSEVTIEDTKYIVGRSWQTNLTSGPKMVNTVIGVHNGDYLKIIKKFKAEFKNAEERLDTLEAKVDALINKDF
jgi:hypothetical protein